MSLRAALLIVAVACLALACKTKEQLAPAVAPPVATPKTSTVTEYLYPFINEALLWGYIDATGQVVVEPTYSYADAFSEGYARVKLGEKWGHIDANGKVIVEPKYERARRFAGGLAAVRVNRKYGYIDHTGTMVIQPQFSKLAQGFSHGLAAVPDSLKKFGFVNREGKMIVAHRFSDAHEFSEGLAAVAEGTKWGFIDTTGNWVLGPQFVWADKFVDGFSLVRIGTQPNVDYALIDRKGEIKFRLQTLHAKTPSQGLIRFELNGKWGFADRTGKFVIPPKLKPPSISTKVWPPCASATAGATLTIPASSRLILNSMSLVNLMADWLALTGPAASGVILIKQAARFGNLRSTGARYPLATSPKPKVEMHLDSLASYVQHLFF